MTPPRSQRRTLLFAAVATLAGLAAILGGLEWVDRIVPITMKQEDVNLHVVESLVRARGTSVQTTWYAELNSPSDAVDTGSEWWVLGLGGSFLFGDPYGEAGDPPAAGGALWWLDEALGDGGRVLNLAGLGDTSTRVAIKAEELLHLGPDVLVVATGNNEYPIPASPPGRAARRRHALVRAVSMLRSPGRGMVDDLEAVYASGPPEAELRARFRSNLETVAASAARHGVPVLLATLPNNLLHDLVGNDGQWTGPDTPCAASLASALSEPGSTRARWVEAWVDRSGPGCAPAVLRQWDAGRWSDALDAGRACPGVEAFGAVGGALAAVGRGEDAAPFLELRAELKPWLIRPSFNDEVRAVAAAHPHVHLADLEATGRARDAVLPSAPAFVDSCHLSWPAYADTAQDLLDALEEAGLSPGPGARVDASDARAASLGLPPRPPARSALPPPPEGDVCAPPVPPR